MIFAKTSKAASRLSNQVREKNFEKTYITIIDGKLEKDIGTMEDYLYKDERTNTSKVVDKTKKNAKNAKLTYEVLYYDQETNLSVVKVKLETGRHHQIRVQFSSRDHSVYGDQKYGNRGKGKQLALWAYMLKVEHPVTKKIMEFQSIPEIGGIWKLLKNIMSAL